MTCVLKKCEFVKYSLTLETSVAPNTNLSWNYCHIHVYEFLHEERCAHIKLHKMSCKCSLRQICINSQFFAGFCVEWSVQSETSNPERWDLHVLIEKKTWQHFSIRWKQKSFLLESNRFGSQTAKNNFTVLALCSGSTVLCSSFSARSWPRWKCNIAALCCLREFWTPGPQADQIYTCFHLWFFHLNSSIIFWTLIFSESVDVCKSGMVLIVFNIFSQKAVCEELTHFSTKELSSFWVQKPSVFFHFLWPPGVTSNAVCSCCRQISSSCSFQLTCGSVLS